MWLRDSAAPGRMRARAARPGACRCSDRILYGAVADADKSPACAPLSWGGMRRHPCPGSGMACPAPHARPLGSQRSRRRVSLALRSVPQSAVGRSCGPLPRWYRPDHRTWLWWCHARIVVSPSWGLGGSTPGDTTSPFTHQRRNGRALSSLTARGGGLPIGVIRNVSLSSSLVRS